MSSKWHGEERGVSGTARGLEDEQPIDGLNAISSAEAPCLLENYDQVRRSQRAPQGIASGACATGSKLFATNRK